MQVMFNVWTEGGGGGGGKGIGGAFEFFFYNFLVEFPTLKREIKYPFLGIPKLLYKSTFVVKIPREGTKEELPHLCPYPLSV